MLRAPQRCALRTRGPQVEVLQKAVKKRLVCLRAGELRAVRKRGDGGKVLPAQTLVPEGIGGHALPVCPFKAFDVAGEHARRGHAVADEIDCQQLLAILAAHARQQAVNLAGRAGKEHRNAARKQRRRVGDGVRRVALHILGAAHAGDFTLVHRADVLHMQAVIKRRAEDHTALRNHAACQRGKHAAGGGRPAHRRIPVLRAKGLHAMRLVRCAHRTALLAQVAGDAQRGIDGGIVKALRIRLHGDGALRADGHARAAARAFRLVWPDRLSHALILPAS